MNRLYNTFFGYRIYRKKFFGTLAVVVLLNIIAFLGILIFFVTSWMEELHQQSQSHFLERERRLSNIQTWTIDYTNKLYENRMLMDDLEALLGAATNSQYIQSRQGISLNNTARIQYFPANIKKIFTDNRSMVTGITLRSDSGLKVLWLENGDICLSFDYQEIEDAKSIPGFGDICVATYAIRDPQQISHTIGAVDFWISSHDIYERENDIQAVWGVVDHEGNLLTGSKMTQPQLGWLKQASQLGVQHGWLEAGWNNRVYFAKLTSSQCSFSYVVVKDTYSIIQDNRYMVLVLLAAMVFLGLVILFFNYAGLRADAKFLSVILSMLGAMEGGHFDQMRRQQTPVRYKENEYGVIANALRDMGMKLEGYIETEYILKLKEQETEMRALQHQINPHFLYNTLETLRSKALQQGDDDTADAIAMLGKLYRARMHKRNSITLQEEFELLEMYLKIMTLRFGDNFVYQMELDPEIRETPTVNFWLQPLAENFFSHGFDRDSMYNLLIVSGHAENGGARIQVIDNGFGVKPELLEDTRRNMYEGNDDAEADIGLRNVYMRLSYFHREGFTMDVGNHLGGGFCISVFIPGRGE